MEFLSLVSGWLWSSVFLMLGWNAMAAAMLVATAITVWLCRAYDRKRFARGD